MTKKEESADNEMPNPGPGVSLWLTQILGLPRASKAKTKPLLPSEFALRNETDKRLAFTPPDEVIQADGGTLRQLEIRGLPKGVTLSRGTLTEEGFWLLSPSQMQGAMAIIPAEISLPFSVMLKGVFVGSDSDAPWSELTGYEFSIETPAPMHEEQTPAAIPARKPEAMPESMPESMVVIDLDVSVGTDDPDILKGITVRFSGLPDGAQLSAGSDDKGIWTVPATELSDLSIIIAENTRDFDLNVEMDIAGSPPQTASIHVENSTETVDPASSFTVHLTPSGYAADEAKTRISIYADGTAIYDRIVNWSASTNQDVELLVPYGDDALPFEIVMRYDSFGVSANAPKLLGLNIDGTAVAPQSSAISGQGELVGSGLVWRGDLIIDVRHALKPPEDVKPDQEIENEQPHLPSEIAEPHANVASASMDVQPASADKILDPSDEPLSQTVDEPEVHLSEPDDDDGIDEADFDAAPPPETSKADVELPEKSDVLIVDASYSDLQRPAFLNELRSLRNFIRTRQSDETGEIYERLGIDVTKWHDMSVRGPTGAEVQLDPLLPKLAPHGGKDNAREMLPLSLSDIPSETGIMIRITGLAPGALLSHGQNLGNGIWQLGVHEIENVSLLPAVADNASRALHIAWNGTGDERDIVEVRKSLIVGLRHAGPKRRGIEMHGMPLPIDPETFDPDGHGSISLTLGEMPPGAILSHGKNHGGGVWTVELDSGQGVSLFSAAATPPFEISLTCVALNPQTGNSTVVSRILDVTPGQSKIRLRTDMAA
ncbi:hypothetical protein L2D14_10815 [Thalassospiraceae bacterium LMO-JJ14]|nr:hypothetical protein L2D14_10815 [Thalassospiraceae bacterium LMO-JJ14]